MRTLIVKSFLALVIALGTMTLPAAAAAGPLQTLPGYWSGWGSVQFDGGSRERIKCRATYFVKNSGTLLQQNLRCTTSSSYKISTRSELLVDGNELSGNWEERKSGNEGSVTGRITSKGFRLTVEGQTFSADMQVDVTKCRQAIKIDPSGLGIKRIFIKLKKSC